MEGYFSISRSRIEMQAASPVVVSVPAGAFSIVREGRACPERKLK